MRTEQYTTRRLAELFKTRKIATMEELKSALNTGSDATVFRKLASLAYHSSYSHRGRYYTLEGIPDYNQLGLWSFREVWFSRPGTLLATAQALVEEAEAGYFSSELETLLHVEVKGCLLKLVREQRIAREKLFGRYLYCSASASRRKQQMVARRLWEAEPALGGPLIEPEVMPGELKAAIILFFTLLDEKQRRLYAGLEALKIGHGGDRRVAELLGLDVGTVARGREELLSQDVEVERTRRSGAGRKRLEKKRQR